MDRCVGSVSGRETGMHPGDLRHGDPSGGSSSPPPYRDNPSGLPGLFRDRRRRSGGPANRRRGHADSKRRSRKRLTGAFTAADGFIRGRLERSQKNFKREGILSYLGTAITTQGSQLVLHVDELAFPILEMETAGILQTAQTYKIPLLVLRAISDGPLAPLPLDLTTVMDEDSRLLPGKLLVELIKHPGILRRAGPMLRNSRIAADNAARAVMIALESELSLLKA